MNKIKMAWIVSIIATCGSLYLSEVMKFVPCEFCWFQRIFMYPLTILLGIAVWKEEKHIITYVLPMSIIGGCISLTHYLKQMVPAFNKIVPCSNIGVPCSAKYLEWFGFITIPFMCLVAFIMITTFLILAKKER